MPRKKPTKKELEKVLSSLIMEVSNLSERMLNIECVFDSYIEYKKEGNEFKKHLEKIIEKSRRKTKK